MVTARSSLFLLRRRPLLRSFSTAASPRLAALRSRLAEESASPVDFARPQPAPARLESYKSQAFAETAASSAPLVDRYARQHTYLRVSLTERCSLRCLYCMPEDGVDLTHEDRLMTPDEMLRLARVFVGAGVNKIRLTGGEPTVRRDLPDVMGALNELRPHGLTQVAVTSNGIALPRMLPKLVEGRAAHRALPTHRAPPLGALLTLCTACVAAGGEWAQPAEHLNLLTPSLTF